MGNIKAAIITIGDELLIGQTIDTNSAWIAQQLNKLGIDVLRRVAVGDDKAAIVKALDEEIAGADIVLVTGGLGPTADDITKPLLSEYFGGKLVVDEGVLAHLKNLFTKRNRPFLERNLKQAEVPDNCEVLFNKMGTAPGMWFEVVSHQSLVVCPADGPLVSNSQSPVPKIIIAMPGVPFEMMSIMEDEVLPRLKKRFVSDALLHRSVITAGEGESFIAEKIQDIEEGLPAHIRLAYLPGAGMVKLRLTGRGADVAELVKELELRQGEIATRLGDIVVALEDIPMAQVLGRWLKANGATIGLAESCTGGNIAQHLTQVVGATDFFKGCIVCYSNEVKENVLGVKKETIAEHGAVSEQSVTEMVQGALAVLNVDYAFAITGMLGPAGENDEVEVGTVWMAVADRTNVKTKRFRFYYDRERNKDMATSMGMMMIWRFLNNAL